MMMREEISLKGKHQAVYREDQNEAQKRSRSSQLVEDAMEVGGDRKREIKNRKEECIRAEGKKEAEKRGEVLYRRERERENSTGRVHEHKLAKECLEFKCAVEVLARDENYGGVGDVLDYSLYMSNVNTGRQPGLE